VRIVVVGSDKDGMGFLQVSDTDWCRQGTYCREIGQCSKMGQ